MTILDVRAGRLLVSDWPADLPRPAGLAPAPGSRLVAPARCRTAVLAALRAAGRSYVDRAARPPCEGVPPVLQATPAAAAALAAVRLAVVDGCGAGLVAGLADVSKQQLALGLRALQPGPGLVLAPDGVAALGWRSAAFGPGWMVRSGGLEPLPPHELLVVDWPELQPRSRLLAQLDASPARLRLGLLAGAAPELTLALAAGLGPLVAAFPPTPGAAVVELAVALPGAVAAAYAAAWHTFLCAYDAFAALQPAAGFGAFVQQARGDPRQRPALQAYHAACQLAAWHAHKAALVGELLRLHRGARILVFTPDRAAAYAIARAHLVPALTGELPRREQAALREGFLAGTLPVLVGPRLADAGLPDGSAEVGILVGGGFGRAQRQARCRRVAASGCVYELVSLDTVEVARARRQRAAVAAATAVVDGDRGR